MDEAAIFTIDAWCQRMLREHAFDSGSLFDEELVSDEQSLFEDAAHDYWRQQVYPLNANSLEALLSCWGDVGALKSTIRELVKRADIIGAAPRAAIAGRADRRSAAQAAGAARATQGRLVRTRHAHGAVDRPAPRGRSQVLQRQQDAAGFAGRWFNGLRDWAQIRPASCRIFRTPRGTA
jgi:exodeoxyribonuclease V beta subunit